MKIKGDQLLKLLIMIFLPFTCLAFNEPFGQKCMEMNNHLQSINERARSHAELAEWIPQVELSIFNNINKNHLFFFAMLKWPFENKISSNLVNHSLVKSFANECHLGLNRELDD